MKRVFITISGGSTKISFLIGACLSVVRGLLNKKVTGYVGNSSGAITAFVMATLQHASAEKYAKTFSYKDFIGFKIDKFLGKLKTAWLFFRKKYYLYDFKALRKTIEKAVPEDVFEKWKEDPRSKDCYIGVTDFEEPEFHLMNLMDYSYKEAIEIIIASCSIPPYNPPLPFKGKVLVDGGLVQHNPSERVLSELSSKFDEIISIYSRPEVMDKDDGEDGDKLKWSFKDNKKFIPCTFRTIEVMSIANSFNSEKTTDEIAKNLGVKVHKIFAPKKLTNSHFELTEKQNMELYEMGVKEGNKLISKLK